MPPRGRRARAELAGLATEAEAECMRVMGDERVTVTRSISIRVARSPHTLFARSHARAR